MSETEPFQLRIVPVTLFQQNCSIIQRPSRFAAVVDPGGEPDKIMAAAKEMGAQISQIWLTHGHLDHAGAAEEIRRRTGALIFGPQIEDDFWLQQIRSSWAQLGIEDGEDCTPDAWLEDGDALDLDGVTFKIAHTPGHTPGHVMFHNSEAKLAFVGDVLFAGSIGRTDFPRGDHGKLIQSITEKLWPLGEDMRFVPGHGPMSTFGRERRTNPFVADSITGYGDATSATAPTTIPGSKRWM